MQAFGFKPNTTLFVYAAGDEDSASIAETVYITEGVILQHIIKEVAASLKNAPTGSLITVDIQKETGVDNNAFATILSTLITIDIGKFNSKTSATQPVISDKIWETNRRMKIIITITDSNFAASGLKVVLTS